MKIAIETSIVSKILPEGNTSVKLVMEQKLHEFKPQKKNHQ